MGEGAAVVVRHLTRVEGHGNIVVDIAGSEVRRCDLEIVESPRFFEVLLKDRPSDEAPRIACRICGICSVAHATASVLAVEAALGIRPGEKLRLLRRLNMAGEWLQSHVLHACFLVAPDAFGATSIVPMVAGHPDLVKSALRLKHLANDICGAVSGRHVMPISYHAGWMGHWPDTAELGALAERLEAARADLDLLVDVFAGLRWPALEGRAEQVAALEDAGAYPMVGGSLRSTAGRAADPKAYGELLREYLVEHSAAKHARSPNGPVRVGALARLSLAADRLRPAGRAAMERLKLDPRSANAFDNVPAQVIEAAHALEEASDLVAALLADPAPEEPAVPTRPRGGEGVGIVEAPRGTLIHHYEVGADGRIARANCLIPTGANLAAIESDMRTFVRTLIGRPQDEIRHALEMLVRAYDPCISCAVH